MKIFQRSIAIAAFSAGLLMSASASATLIEFTDRAAFNAATSGRIVEPNTAPPGDYIAIDNETLSGIAYPSYAYMIDPAYAPALYEFGTGAILLLSNDTQLSFAPVTAFAADFASLGDRGTDITLTINGESVVLPMAFEPQLTFYGFISSTAFDSVSLATNAELIVLDNVTRANVATGVPEPRTLALLAMALAALALSRRRRR